MGTVHALVRYKHMEEQKRASSVFTWETQWYAKEGPQTSVYSHSWIKETSPRAHISQSRERCNTSKQPLITWPNLSCFRDWTLQASTGSGCKYYKLCYRISFIHCYYGKVWLENYTFETDIIKFRDNWKNHWIKQISQVLGPRAIPKDSSTICLFQVCSAICLWKIYY